MTKFLILHKVRGEPAFDIAEKCQISDEEGWVLCTCGHRAYPYKWWRLETIHSTTCDEKPMDFDVPEDWPDHYSPKPEKKISLNILELVSTMLPKMKRRI
jgi:hypothetical protein